jgi:cleavage and polyadenylation specificity factor subunit 1
LDDSLEKDRLAIRMAKINSGEICRDSKTYNEEDEDKLQPLDQRPRPTFLKKLRLRKFENVGFHGTGLYSGVFVSGKTPVWLIMATKLGNGLALEHLHENDQNIQDSPLPITGKGKLQQHPMISDGPILCFAPLHNVNVQNGFVYVSDKGHLRLCQLPAQFNYDTEWPLCKIPIGRTPEKITNHYSSQTYVVGTSTSSEFIFSKAQYAAAVASGVIDEGEELLDSEMRFYGFKDEIRTKGMYWPTAPLYKLELISPVTWETVDTYVYQLII